MTLRPLRELTTHASADEALASRLANAFPPAAIGAIPPARATLQGGRRAWLPIALRPALVLLVLALAAVASATIGVLRLVRAPLAPRSAVAPLPSPKPTHHVATATTHAAELEELPAPTPPIIAALPAAIETPIVSTPHVAAATPVPAPAAEAAPPPVLDTKSEDFTLLVDAMRALRSEHDPARAATLAASYRAKHPQGALVEEALAITVEASLAANDPAARTLAADYLARYPRGRYAAAARNALAAP